MKKLIFIFSLFICIQVSGQYPGIVAAGNRVTASGDYPAILDDADTEAWYSAEEENVTLDANDSLTLWQDRTTNNRDLNEESTYQAFWDADGVHMLNVGDAGAYRFDVTIAKPLTIYIVFKNVTWTSQDEILQLNSSGPLFKQYFTGTRCYVYDDGNLGYVEVANDTWVLATIVLNGASSLIQENGEAAQTGTVGTNDLTNIKVGGIDVVIKEIIIRSAADNETNRTAVQAYLNDKYSIY